jgi:saccharopine dehydrogenase-like NADP-dependent oxidoreductase
MKLLLNDLRLRDRRDLLKEIFEAAIPTTEQDVIVIQASASGRRNGRLEEESYPVRIFGADVDGHRLSAIQLSTAAGICAALDLVAQGVLPQRGFVGQEAIDLETFAHNRYGRVYAGKPLALAGRATADR